MPTTPEVPAPRVAAGRGRQVGLVARVLAYGGARRYGTEPIALFLVLGRHKRLFRAWLLFAGALMPGGRLPRRDTELVILRVAAVTGSAYEAAHHRRIGARAGLTEVELVRVEAGADAPGWSPRQTVLLRATDHLLEHHDLDDDTWAALRGYLDEPRCVEFCLLVGHYRMLADTITALRLRPERPRSSAVRPPVSTGRARRGPT